MDSSTSTAADIDTKQPSDQPINRTQPPAVSPSAVTPKTTMTISVGKEAGPSSVVIAESPDDGEDEEDELRVASQEKKTQVVSSQGGGAGIEEEIEVQPVPEFSASPEVEKYIEVTDIEKPDIKEIAKDGVTHSGTGVIPDMIAISKNNFGVKTMPESFDQAVNDEHQSRLHDSKHWFSAMIIYIWRKLNPKIKKTVPTKPVKKAVVHVDTTSNENEIVEENKELERVS